MIMEHNSLRSHKHGETNDETRMKTELRRNSEEGTIFDAAPYSVLLGEHLFENTRVLNREAFSIVVKVDEHV